MRFYFLLVFLLVFFQGCGNESLQPDKSVLESKVRARWDALMARDYESAYQYFSPAYRKFYSLEDYKSDNEASGSVEWKSVDIQNLLVSNDQAKVKINVNYVLQLPDPAFNAAIGEISSILDETWVWVGSEWWYVKKSGKSGLL